jgi:hypothetical protein
VVLIPFGRVSDVRRLSASYPIVNPGFCPLKASALIRIRT